jgi:hypothetical protein
MRLPATSVLSGFGMVAYSLMTDRAGGRFLLQIDMAGYLRRFNYDISCLIRCIFSSRKMSPKFTMHLNTR